MFEFFDDLVIDGMRMLRNLLWFAGTVCFWVVLAYIAVRWGWI